MKKKTLSSDQNDKSALLSLMRDLEEILMLYGPKNITSPICELEEISRKEIEQLTSQQFAVAEELEKIKQKHALALSEYNELKRTFAVLQATDNEQLKLHLLNDIYFEMEYLSYLEKKIEVVADKEQELEDIGRLLTEKVREKEEIISNKKAQMLFSHGWLIDEFELEDLSCPELVKQAPRSPFPPFTLHLNAAISLLLHKDIIKTSTNKQQVMRDLAQKRSGD